LVVDDDLPTLQALELLLRKELGEEAVIDPAGNVPDAQKLIQKAYEDRRSYDAAVLDVMLPPDASQSATLDARLCAEIRNKMPGALVVHITAYTVTVAVRRHLDEFHYGEPEPRAFPKSAGWEGEVVKRLKSRLHGNGIRAQLDGLFGPIERTGSERARGRYPLPGMRGGLTHRLARLTRDIEAHWTELEGDLQREVQKNFHVDRERGGGVLVTLKMPGSE
jgi:CheY-like chemotaxis protein